MWLVRELQLLGDKNKFDVGTVEAAKEKAVLIVEGASDGVCVCVGRRGRANVVFIFLPPALRMGGLIEPAKKWAQKLGTLRKAMRIKPDETTQWNIDSEELRKYGCDVPVSPSPRK